MMNGNARANSASRQRRLNVYEPEWACWLGASEQRATASGAEEMFPPARATISGSPGWGSFPSRTKTLIASSRCVYPWLFIRL